MALRVDQSSCHLVMLDPVGTGFSRFIGAAEGEDFWGVDQDINSVGDFIAQYVTENKRWASPKFILGESYGGMRSAGLAYNLLTRHNLALNGVALVSPFLEFATSNSPRNYCAIAVRQPVASIRGLRAGALAYIKTPWSMTP